jgi:hypothetical protein
MDSRRMARSPNAWQGLSAHGRINTERPKPKRQFINTQWRLSGNTANIGSSTNSNRECLTISLDGVSHHSSLCHHHSSFSSLALLWARAIRNRNG